MDVFISYSRKDREIKDSNGRDVISVIQEAFQAAGISYWLDEEGIHSGETFASVISRNIADSKVFLFVSSKNSNSSRWTCGEIATASSYDKRIIPFKIDKAPYDPSVTIYLAALDAIDYTAGPGRALRRLVKEVRADLEEIDAEARRVEEQKVWLAEQERVLVEKERIRKEKEKKEATLLTTRSELEGKIRALDTSLDALLSEKASLLGKLSVFKARMAALNDSSTIPELSTEGNISTQTKNSWSSNVSDYSLRGTTETLDKHESKKRGFPVWAWVLVVGAFLIVGLWWGWGRFFKGNITANVDNHETIIAVDSLTFERSFDTLDVSPDYGTSQHSPSQNNALDNKSVSNTEIVKVSPVAESSNVEVAPIEEKSKDTNNDCVDFVSLWYDAINDLSASAGSKTVSVKLPSGYRIRDIKVVSNPEWCRAKIDKSGLILEWEDCPIRANPEKGELEKEDGFNRYIQRSGDVIFKIKREEAILHVSQNRTIRLLDKDKATEKNNESRLFGIDSAQVRESIDTIREVTIKRPSVSIVKKEEKEFIQSLDSFKPIKQVQSENQESEVENKEESITPPSIYKLLTKINGVPLYLYKKDFDDGSIILYSPIQDRIWKALMRGESIDNHDNLELFVEKLNKEIDRNSGEFTLPDAGFFEKMGVSINKKYYVIYKQKSI